MVCGPVAARGAAVGERICEGTDALSKSSAAKRGHGAPVGCDGLDGGCCCDLVEERSLFLLPRRGYVIFGFDGEERRRVFVERRVFVGNSIVGGGNRFGVEGESGAAAPWADVLKNWLSFVGLTLLTLVSTVLERAVVAGQVQQIMQLPGQMPLEKVLEHLGTLLGFKAVHLFAEGLRTALQARLGAKLDAEARRIDPSCGEPGRPSGPRLLVAEAGPKLLVEASYALIGAGAALATSPTFAAFYVAHDALMGQLAGLGAASLSAKRDNKMHVLDDIQRSSDIEAYRRVDADVALHDAQNLLDRFADASQLLMVSSFALCSTALIDKSLIDLSTYQKVMVFVSTAMQSTGELAQAFDKVNKGSAHITHLMELEEQTHQNSNSSSSLLSPAT